MSSLQRNKTHRLLAAAAVLLSFSLTAFAEGFTTETVDLSSLRELGTYLGTWKGGIDEVIIQEASERFQVTVVGRKDPQPPLHTIITMEGNSSRIREFTNKKTAERFMSATRAELALKNSKKTEIFSLKHALALDLAELVARTVNSPKSGVVVSIDQRGNALVITATPGAMEIVRNTIIRLDMPAAPEPLPKNVMITAYLLEGSMESGDPGKVPTVLERVVKELSVTFQYAHYRLLDTLLVRTREGRPARTSGSLPETASGETGEYSFSFDEAVVREFEDTQMVQLANLRLQGVLTAAIPPVVTQNERGFQSRSRVSRDDHRFSVAADVDIREGQKVVVGKANLSGPGRAIFFVLTTEILD